MMATCVPSARSVAACTCPMEPLAKGVSSKSAKRVSNEAPKERSTSCRVQPKPWAGAW